MFSVASFQHSYKIINILYAVTNSKRRDRVGIIPDWYLRGPGFKYQAGDWLSQLESVILLNPSRLMKRY
jgi:hypothetical protein